SDDSIQIFSPWKQKIAGRLNGGEIMTNEWTTQ
ncbi:unnamed protein product, partial [Rotaria sp. Silwood1]